MNKWIGISLGTVLGISHIGMIGMLSTRNGLPPLNLPVSEFTTYEVEASKNGYRIKYRANDPKVMRVERDIKRKGGFLGLGNNTTRTTEEYTMDGSKHLGGEEVPKLSAKQIECIEARGGGKQTGRLVGSSAGAAVAPAISGIPIVGWLAAGWVTMFGGDQGAEIGGIMAEDIVKACREEVK
tara:strand:+ start:6653 stop:7198 length:546 start_codon:yes stop_codon:yes gene_type:complete